MDHQISHQHLFLIFLVATKNKILPFPQDDVIVQTLRTNELKVWTVLSTDDIVQTFELTNFKVWTVLSTDDIIVYSI